MRSGSGPLLSLKWRPRLVDQSNVFELKVHNCLSQSSSCDPDEMAWLEVDQHTGLVLARLHTEYAEMLCPKHGRQLFLKATAWTLVFGWWGFLSMFITPGTLLNNVTEYGKFRAALRRERRSIEQLSQ